MVEFLLLVRLGRKEPCGAGSKTYPRYRRFLTLILRHLTALALADIWEISTTGATRHARLNVAP